MRVAAISVSEGFESLGQVEGYRRSHVSLQLTRVVRRAIGARLGEVRNLNWLLQMIFFSR